MFQCDLLSHASSSTSLRPYRAEIERDHEEYAVDYISDVNIDNWPKRRGPYLHFLTHFVSFDILDCCCLSKLMIVNNCQSFGETKIGIISLGENIICTLRINSQ